MAKKQPSTEKKAKPAAKASAKTGAKNAKAASESLFQETGDEPKAAKSTKKAAPAASRPLSIEEIGHAAGEVWAALAAADGGLTLAGLKKSVAAPGDLVLLGLGWLAREDKVSIDAGARTPTISLK